MEIFMKRGKDLQRAQWKTSRKPPGSSGGNKAREDGRLELTGEGVQHKMHVEDASG
jgi:hypothetical protein